MTHQEKMDTIRNLLRYDGMALLVVDDDEYEMPTKEMSQFLEKRFDLLDGTFELIEEL